MWAFLTSSAYTKTSPALLARTYFLNLILVKHLHEVIYYHSVAALINASFVYW
jgi:hypothetical protein